MLLRTDIEIHDNLPSLHDGLQWGQGPDVRRLLRRFNLHKDRHRPAKILERD